MGGPLSRPAALVARLEAPVEEWPYLDEGTLLKTRSRKFCMTCHWFRHHAGVNCIPVLVNRHPKLHHFRHRKVRHPLLVTSNQPFSDWEEVFDNTAMSVAAVDRLVDNSTVIVIEGQSYWRRRSRRLLV